MPQMQGAEMERALRGAGVPEPMIAEWRQDKIAGLRAANVPEPLIRGYFGMPLSRPEVFSEAAADQIADLPKDPPEGLLGAAVSGWERSVSGLVLGRPTTGELPETAPITSKLAQGAAGFAGDFPAYVVGGLAGRAAGGGAGAGLGFLAGGPAGAATGAVVGQAVGAPAGAFGLAALLRQVLMDEYEQGTIESFDEFWLRFSDAMVAATKGTATGAATGLVGGVTRPLGPLTSFGSELGTMLTVGAKLEGEVPTFDELVVGTALIGGLRGIPPAARGLRAAQVRAEPAFRHTADKLRRIYVRTGTRPNRLLEQSRADASIREDVVSSNIGTPRALEPEAVARHQDPILGPAAKHLAKTGDADPRRMARKLGITRTEAEIVLDELELAGVVGPKPTFAEPGPRRVLTSDPSEVGQLVRKHRGVLAEKPADRPGELLRLDSELADKQARLAEVRKKSAQQLREEGEIGNAEGQIPHKTKLVEKLMQEEDLLRAKLENAELKREGGAPKPPAETPPAPARGEPPKPGSIEEAEAHFRGKIVKTEEGAMARIRRRFREGWSFEKFYTDAVDRFHPLNKAMRQVAEEQRQQGIDELEFLRAERARREGKPPPAPIPREATRDVRLKQRTDPVSILDDAYRKARLNVAWVNRVNTMLDVAMIRFGDYRVVGPALRQILEPVKKAEDMDRFTEYVAAHRTLELEARGLRSGFDPALARRLATNPEKIAKFERTRLELVEFQHQLLDYLRASGIVSDTQYQLMTEAGRDYMPFHRLFDESPTIRKEGAQSLRRYSGSERSIHDPIESIIKNVYAMVRIAEKNDVHRTWVKAADAVGRTDLAERVATKVKPIRVSKQEKARLIKKAVDGRELTREEQALFDKVMEEEFSVFRPDSLRAGENEIVVYEKGERQVWRVEPEIADALRAMDPRAAGVLSRVLSTPARALRAGVVLDPAFQAKNPARDTLVAFLQQPGFRFFLDTMDGFASEIGKTQHWRDFQKSGGPQAEMIALDRAYNQKNVRELTRQTGLMTRARNVVTSPIHALQTLAMWSEQATRIGASARESRNTPVWMTMQELAARARGRASRFPELSAEDLLRGGFASRESTVDFARMGAVMSEVNRHVAFSNVFIQGLDKMGRQLRDQPTATVTKAVVALTLPALVLEAVNNSPENRKWYDGIPDYEKDLFLVWSSVDDNGDRAVHRFPKPFEYGQVFMTVPQRWLRAAMREDKGTNDAVDKFVQNMGRGVITGVMPTTLLPPLEQYTNYSFYMQRPLISQEREKALPIVQTRPYTTELSKAVAGAIGQVTGLDDNPGSLASPVILDNYIRGWTGGLGQHVIRLLDKGLQEAGVLPESPVPEGKLSKNPFVRAFQIRYPSMNDQRIQDFYDKAERIDAFDRTFALLQNDQQWGLAKEFAKRNTPYIALDVDNTREALANTRRAISRVTMMPDDLFPKEEKDQMIEKLMFRAIHTAEAGNTMADAIIDMAEKRLKETAE